MNLSRLLLALVAGCCLLRPSPLLAADPAPPFTMEKQYSADIFITTEEGTKIPSSTYVDGDKMRSNTTINGMSMSLIMRRDKQKIYQLLTDQKIAMEMPFDPSKYKGKAGASMGPEGKFDLIGPDTVDGVACTKYKVTPEKSKEIYFFWLETERKVPVQMTDSEGKFKVQWKNFKKGPQDAALFEIPPGYTTTQMPTMPGTEAPAKPSEP